MIFYSPYIGAEMLRSYKWDGSGSGWDLCVGLLYEHRFAVLIIREKKRKNLRASKRGRWCWAEGCLRLKSSLSPGQARSLGFDHTNQKLNKLAKSIILALSPIMAPKAAAPAIAAVVNIRSLSENHTWLTWAKLPLTLGYAYSAMRMKGLTT